jgi:hypothetical protein
MRKFLFVFIVLALPYTTVIAQNLTIEQKAKIFWQGFVNSYKKDKKYVHKIDNFDPDGVKVDWPIAIYSNFYDSEFSINEFKSIEIISFDDYNTQNIDYKNYNWEKINYKGTVAKIFNGSSSFKVFEFDKITDLIQADKKVSFTDFFIEKYDDTSEIYVVTNHNLKNNETDYFVTFLKFDGKKFKLAAIYTIEERGD